MNKELIAPRIGKRNDEQYRLREMIDAQVNVAYGSDWPITSEKPLLALAVPVHRTEPGKPGEPWNPDQAIDLEQSWGFYTEAVAYQNYREEYLGAIEVGMRADFIILDRNPFSIPITKIHEVGVESVFKAGVKVI